MPFPSVPPRSCQTPLPTLHADQDKILKGWSLSGPHPGSTAWIEKALVEQIADSLLAGKPGWKDIPMQFEALQEEDYRQGGPDRIDMDRIYARKGSKGTLVLAGIMEVTDPGLFRLILDRLRSVALVSGHRCEDGSILHLEKGHHAMVILADNLPDYAWDQFYLQPRWIPCSETEAVEVTSLMERREAEADSLRSAPEKKPRLEPGSFIGTKGHVRAAKSEGGHWWFVDADNRPFLYQGVTSVNRMGTQGGRRAMPGDYTSTVEKRYRYSEEGPEAFVQATLDKLAGAGLNGLGSWSHPEFFEREGFFTTDILEAIRVFPSMEGTQWCDVFDPAWVRRVDEVARAICSPQKNSRWLLGYFTENEITFPAVGTLGYDITGNPIYHHNNPSLLEICLDQDTHAPAFQAAWNFVVGRHGDEASALQAWGVKSTARRSLTALRDKGLAVTGQAFAADSHAFAVHFAEIFFRTCYEAIKRHDPNHLVLGCRWAGPPHPDLLNVEEKWTDVVSINNYKDMLHERISEYGFATDIPVIIGEYNWSDDGHMSISLPFEPAAGLTMEERTFYTGERYLKRLFLHPRVAGWTWYRFVTTNRLHSFRNCGMVNHEDEVQPFNYRNLRAITAHAEPSRVDRDHTPPLAASLEDGDYTLLLQGSSASEGRARVNKLVCGIRVRNGRIDAHLYGYGLQGRVIPLEDFRFTIEGAFTEVVFPRGQGPFAAEVHMEHRKGEHFTGTYKGRWSGRDLSGEASAWRE